MKIFSPQIFTPLLLAGFILVGCGESTSPSSQADSNQQKQLTVAQNTEQEPEVSSDLHPGKALHDANCISCHDSAVYTRDNRKVSDFPILQAQVRRCDANLGSRLFDDEMEEVAKYLNQAYYEYEI